MTDTNPPDAGPALELHEIQTRPDDDPSDLSSASISSGEYRIAPRRTTSRTSQRSREEQQQRRPGLWGDVCRFWTRNVVLVVPQKNNRDHFALERTFLAYIRTSLVLAMQGVLIAQLFRLQRRRTHSTTRLGFYEVAEPLSLTCYCVAIVIAVLGAHRFWKQQHAISIGKVYAGGWELNCIGGLIFLISLTTFVLAIAIIIEIETES